MKVQLRKIGFIVNPVAGMGGRVGLKGTDGEETLRKALELGAKPLAPERSKEALKVLGNIKSNIQLFTYSGEMGEDEARECGFNPCVIGSSGSVKTSATDTKIAVEGMVRCGVELILFVGGDGTARDVCGVVGENVPVLGVPAGVKIHSAVFAVDPQAAAVTVMRFLFEELPLREMEVMDVDETAFREGRVSAKLYGYMLTPYEPDLIQGTKVESVMTEDEMRNQAAIAIRIIEEMNPNVIYVVGPGTTTRIIGDLLNEKKTLLGVDLFYCNKILAKDVDETRILKEIKGKKAEIIITPIGGQGFIFGRGNQQISPKVIREVGLDNIIIVATRHKLRGLRSLRVDTGDAKLDEQLRGNRKVVIDYREEYEFRVE